MNSIYGSIPNGILSENITDLIGQIFKLLPCKEDNDQYLDFYFATLLLRIRGMTEIFSDCPELITVMSLVEGARNESDFALYRKAILDSCSIMKKLQDQLNERVI